MRATGWIVAAAVLAMAGVALAEEAPKPARLPYSVDRDPCGPMMKQYCAESLSKMDHPAIHACLLSHLDEVPNACRVNMAAPKPPLRQEDASGAPISTPPVKGG
jgi:hypothetical protein